MVPAPQDEDEMLEGEQEAGEGHWASTSFKPGRVVWAKVEGHDWWPAKVGEQLQHAF